MVLIVKLFINLVGDELWVCVDSFINLLYCPPSLLGLNIPIQQNIAKEYNLFVLSSDTPLKTNQSFFSPTINRSYSLGSQPLGFTKRYWCLTWSQTNNQGLNRTNSNENHSFPLKL